LLAALSQAYQVGNDSSSRTWVGPDCLIEWG
jgi:hypothetical protein